jgi:glycosyltransferase involved in cell wall biosynthesis
MHITHLISNLEPGGAETSLATLVEATQGSNIRHTVVSLLPRGVLRGRLERTGASVIELEGGRGLRGALSLPDLRNAVRKNDPDVLQCWMYHANIAGSVLKMIGTIGCPVIWGIRQGARNIWLDRLTTRAAILAGVPFSRLPERIVYNSEHSAEEHERLGYAIGPRVIIPNGIDCNRFQPRPAMRDRLRAELGLHRDTVLIGRVARYAPMKDYPTALHALASVINGLPDAHLAVIGPSLNGESAQIVSLAQELGCGAHVHILRRRLDIENFYPALDLLISSSKANEGFPNSVAEALACETLVVSTSVGESLLVQAGSHRLVRPEQPEELSRAILDLLSVAPEAKAILAQQGRDFILKNFSQESFASAFAKLWQETCAEWRTKRH